MDLVESDLLTVVIVFHRGCLCGCTVIPQFRDLFHEYKYDSFKALHASYVYQSK